MNCEHFECLNCSYSGPLNVHGRCEHCNSDSVMSQEVIMAHGRFLSAEQYVKIDVCSLFGIPSHMVGQA